MSKFDPNKSFESPMEAVDYCNEQVLPMDAFKAVVLANIDEWEFGFASELVAEGELIQEDK